MGEPLNFFRSPPIARRLSVQFHAVANLAGRRKVRAEKRSLILTRIWCTFSRTPVSNFDLFQCIHIICFLSLRAVALRFWRDTLTYPFVKSRVDKLSAVLLQMRKRGMRAAVSFWKTNVVWKPLTRSALRHNGPWNSSRFFSTRT